MKTLLKIGFVIAVIALYYSCDKIKSYPAQPQIGYQSFSLVDTVDTLQNQIKKLTITFSFVDGDGDLFKSPTDTFRKDSLNSKLFFIFYQMVDGKYLKVPDSVFLGKPYFSFGWNDLMLRDGQNKTQKGIMEFYYNFYYPLPFDTITVSFYVVDLASNKSNVDSVPVPIILKPKIP